MTADSLARVCDEAIDAGRYVYLVHRGVGRDVYPFGIRNGYLYVWCSLHADRELEKMNLGNIYRAEVSEREIGYVFGYETDFGTG